MSSRRKEKKKSSSSSPSAVANNKEGDESKTAKSVCTLCSGHGDEEHVLLCDGEGCTHEIHMFCLKPPMLIVPPGTFKIINFNYNNNNDNNKVNGIVHLVMQLDQVHISIYT